MSFKFHFENTQAAKVLHLSGTIDENADFSKIELTHEGLFIIDLKGITQLNSVGLRSWVLWMVKLEQHPSLFLRHCPRNVVHQMNTLVGFFPLGAIIESLEVPFYCESCGNEFSFWAHRGTDYVEALENKAAEINIPLSLPCPKCGAASDADILLASYFNFLSRRRG